MVVGPPWCPLWLCKRGLRAVQPARTWCFQVARKTFQVPRRGLLDVLHGLLIGGGNVSTWEGGQCVNVCLLDVLQGRL